MKHLLVAIAIVGFCVSASAQEVKEKTKTKTEIKRSPSTPVVRTSVSSHKAYRTHHITSRHYYSHATRTKRMHHAGYRTHHTVYKKHYALHHKPYAELKRKHENGKYKVKYKSS